MTDQATIWTQLPVVERTNAVASATNMVTTGLRVGTHLTLQERFEEWLATPGGQAVAPTLRDRLAWTRMDAPESVREGRGDPIGAGTA